MRHGRIQMELQILRSCLKTFKKTLLNVTGVVGMKVGKSGKKKGMLGGQKR